MKKIIITVLIIFWFVSISSAATIYVSDYGDGTCSQSNVQAAIDASEIGDIVKVPAGELTWSTGISITKGITLQGAGMSETILTANSGFTLIVFTGDDTVITGFHLKAPSTASVIIRIRGDNWRIHHNKIECVTENAKLAGVFARGVSSAPNPTGLIDNNTFINTQVVSMGSADLLTSGGDTQNEIYAEAIDLGGSSTVYIEDNTFTMTAEGNVIDGNYASSYVARFNAITSLGWGSTIESHSMQSTANRANRRWEIYGNTLIGSSSKWVPFFIRGGTGVIFNNSLSGTFSNEAIYFDNVRSYKDVGGTAGLCDGDSAWDGNFDTTGWPCRDQIGTGADLLQWENDPPAPYAQASVPAYVWSNLNTSGAEMAVTVINLSENHIKANRDYYALNASFDGTSGVGVGTLANRPTTCTTGVGYWATDQGSWNNKTPGGEQGVLYKCISTNTWEKYYEPYEYPHPLTKEIVIAAPELMLKDTFSGGSVWTKSTGKTYTYYLTSKKYGGKNIKKVSEDGTELVETASIDLCESTTGSYFVDPLDGTVHVHCTDGADSDTHEIGVYYN